MKRELLSFVVTAVLVALPISSFADYIRYSVDGTVVDDLQIERDISGFMIISDQALDWVTEQPVPSDTDCAKFGFPILEWSITVGEYSYSGQPGYSFHEANLYIQLECINILGDTMWFLGDYDHSGIGDWDYWIGEIMYFYHEDGTPYDPTREYVQLAPIIRLGLPTYVGDPVFGGEGVSGDMWLTQQPADYPQTANTIAASYGRPSLIGSGVFNCLGLILLPLGAVILLRILRRKR